MLHRTLSIVELPFIGLVDFTGSLLTLFLVCLFAVLSFEVVNGFHDTANAVATVIYTNTLKPYTAIAWSGLCNFLGVFVIGTAVAMSLLQLVPLDRLINLPVQVGGCLVMAILVASMVWNLSTWYVGLPLSSSHTLIGAMIGASIGFSFFYGGGVNWEKAKEIGFSLLISPLIGFMGSALLMYLEKRYIKSDELFHAPETVEDKPPLPIRMLLIATCSLVSFFHGSNDGQKGVGLLMLVLVAFLPVQYGLNPDLSAAQLTSLLAQTQQTLQQVNRSSVQPKADWQHVEHLVNQTHKLVASRQFNQVRQKYAVRKQLQNVVTQLKALTSRSGGILPINQKRALLQQAKSLEHVTDFAPIWVLLAISLSLGLGTMVGWKRIVVTIGERIGHQHLNYAQGATAELVAASTIGLSTLAGLPVSTTHVLSSGVAGAMAASGGTKNLNYSTLKQIALAWLLTLPAAMGLSLLFFVIFHLWV